MLPDILPNGMYEEPEPEVFGNESLRYGFSKSEMLGRLSSARDLNKQTIIRIAVGFTLRFHNARRFGLRSLI